MQHRLHRPYVNRIRNLVCAGRWAEPPFIPNGTPRRTVAPPPTHLPARAHIPPRHTPPLQASMKACGNIVRLRYLQASTQPALACWALRRREPLLGDGEADTLVLLVELGIVLADEDIAQDPDRSHWRGHVQPNEARQTHGDTSRRHLSRGVR